jgi:HTH-type transcriptional regulator / antitoxin HipB
MKSHKQYLIEQMKDPEFKKGYLYEKKMAEIAVRIQEARLKQGLSQQELARRAHVTQQQLSSIENGSNFTIKTFLKIREALRINITL